MERPFNRDWILFHLTEAQGEIAKTLEGIRATPDFGYGEFSVSMQHLYHHLNTAWNSREAPPTRVEPVSEEDFAAWSRFPTDLPMFGE